MGKYTTYNKPPEPKKKTLHPIWRGIGFILLILAPVIAYFATLYLLDLNSQRHWFTIPRDLLVRGSDPLLLVKVISTIALVLVLYAVFMLITFLIYRIFGPPRYGPQDAPSEVYHGTKYRR